MSESSSSSDSDSSSSSCGWTVLGPEGCEDEAEGEGEGSSSVVAAALLAPPELPSLQQQEPRDSPAELGQGDVTFIADQSHPEIAKTLPEDGKEKLPDDNTCVGAISDDSDIVTLEAPKVEEIGSHEGLVPCGDKEPPASEDFNMGSSSSSQYTFCQPETACWLEKLWKIPVCVSGWVFPPQPSAEESSSDETSNRSSPALRRRRAKKRLVSSSESEDGPPHEQQTEPVKDPSPKHQFSSGLNRCIILALVIAVSMGFGHFYGTVQIQERQQLVEKTHEDELNDMKDSLIQCQEQQGSKTECKSLKEGLAACLLTTEREKKSFESQKDYLASENLHLRESLEKEEKALALLQEELRKLREQIRHLENKGLESPVATENQKLKAHLEEEKHRMQSFVKQKETLLAEAQMLRRELDKERQLTMALREDLEKLSAQQAAPEVGAGEGRQKNQEIEFLRGKLTELEKKLSFEQQRSDLWEKLYIEAKDHVEKQEQAGKVQRPAGKGTGKARKKPKATFFGSVKETFDAMKNSTKEFVRHHKEKIKQAKEAVKENLRKFSDSVKSTFRHFKDTTKNIFEQREKKWYGEKRHEAGRKGKKSSFHEGPHHRAPGDQRERGEGRRAKDSTGPECPTCKGKPRTVHKGCTGIFDCAHQEFVSLFDKALDPIRADEFNQLMHKYLQQEVNNFHHWRELETFMNQFFCNGVFIHDQMLFTDFVNDIKDYLEDMKEYHGNSDGAFEDLDKYIYQYYFHYEPAPQYGPSHPAKKAPFMHTQSGPQERHVPKHQQRNKREGRWHKQGRTNGRHTANLEIEVGQMPFHPKY